MTRPRFRIVACTPAVALAAVVAAGCSSASHPGALPSPSANDATVALSVGREFAQCARQHGKPDFPDPAIQEGVLAFPGATKEDQFAVQDACGSILQRVPVSMVHQAHAPSPQEMAQLRQFAQCLRENGMPEWPDPKADGTFPIVGTPLEAEGKSQRLLDARKVCDKYMSGGISGS
jgi:hypothetical protein